MRLITVRMPAPPLSKSGEDVVASPDWQEMTAGKKLITYSSIKKKKKKQEENTEEGFEGFKGGRKTWLKQHRNESTIKKDKPRPNKELPL